MMGAGLTLVIVKDSGLELPIDVVEALRLVELN
jgi:hypothetical protein